jgi:hypothetical protein
MKLSGSARGVSNFFALRPVEGPKFLCYSHKFVDAGVAQLVEQLTCNQQVGGSIPFASSCFSKKARTGGRAVNGSRL